MVLQKRSDDLELEEGDDDDILDEDVESNIDEIVEMPKEDSISGSMLQGPGSRRRKCSRRPDSVADLHGYVNWTRSRRRIATGFYNPSFIVDLLLYSTRLSASLAPKPFPVTRQVIQ